MSKKLRNSYYYALRKSCNMNAFFSFDIFMVCIQNVSKSQELWNNTRRYEMLHTLNLGCSFITLREPCNNLRPIDVILHGFMSQFIYTTVFWDKRLNNLKLRVRLTRKTVEYILLKLLNKYHPFTRTYFFYMHVYVISYSHL